ncbi:MAG: proton-conducting transporter membrane subunit [Pseudomonadota bacterium]
MNELLFTLALALPLGLLLACFAPAVRRWMPRLLWLAPLPALLLALLPDAPAAWVVGNAHFSLHFALDMPGRILLGVAALLWTLAGLYAQGWLRLEKHGGGFVVTWLMSLTGLIGVFLAADLISFYFLLAVLSFGASGMVLQGRGSDALRAGSIYLGLALLAEAFLLAAFVLLAAATPNASLLIADAAAALPQAAQRELILALLLLGFGMKAGLVPLHFWMPLAYAAAPIPAAAVLSGAVVKASVLGLLRFLPASFAAPDFGLPLATLGLFAAFYGVAIGITQRHPKHILAYSSVSQMGFILAMIGMGLASDAAGVALAVAFYAAHHVLVKGALFLAVGVVAHSGRKHLTAIFLPAVIIALGLGGLALSGGALAKYLAKDLMGEGLAGTLAMLTSVTSSLLMLHLLHRLWLEQHQQRETHAPCGLIWPWLGMALAAVLIPWALYLTLPLGTLQQALALKSLWDGLWPVLLGGLLFLALLRAPGALPVIAPGDVIAVLRPLGQVNAALGKFGVALDNYSRRWLVATLSLVALAIAFVSLLANMVG